MKAYINARIFTGEKFLKDRVLLSDKGLIVDIVGEAPEGVERIDCGNGILSAGMIDLQIYGGGGYLFSAELTGESLMTIADDLVRKGTTGFYITLATNSFGVFRQAVEIVKSNPHPAIMGVHLEGPYINPVKKGAHLEQYIKKTEAGELKEFLDFASGTVKMMTVAPEQCNKDSLDLLLDKGVLLSAGHSNATFDQANEGFRNGVRTATHLFNAMSPFHHRDPGLPGAIFRSDHVKASIIPDGIHVNYEVVKIAKQLMGDRLFYITDAVEEVRKGEYIHIRQKDHFSLPDGTLSGSALTMPLAVKNGVEKASFSIEESLRMATVYPAKLAGLTDVGWIKKGYKSNLVCLDENFEPVFTVLGEEMIKAKEG